MLFQFDYKPPAAESMLELDPPLPKVGQEIGVEGPPKTINKGVIVNVADQERGFGQDQIKLLLIAVDDKDASAAPLRVWLEAGNEVAIKLNYDVPISGA